VVPAEAGIKGRSVHALDTRGQVTCCQAARQSAKYAKRPATAACHPPYATCTARTNPRQGRPRRWLRLQPPRRVSPLLRRCHRSCFLGLGQQAVKMSQDVMSEFQATLNPSRIFWISLHVGSKYSLDIWGPAIGSRILFDSATKLMPISFRPDRKEMGARLFAPYFESDMLACWLA